MQLSKIKISGFKSFVDPTTIDLPSHLVAIVGPNGCGKSNIIDAVTWVMGESSPKYLRGESLTDVIFNGSSARKPVGQASVELLFDNSDATIGGEYAKFTDISVRRVINRDSDSVYYLNGVRCRKRDMVDIFLGTGLGPRSYSIIGQNMITRIIEAKPDELRTYFEEAAGISKYKERRHETELRIGHTKENLDRIKDVHAELEKQLHNLKNQANVAEKYKSLKQQERIVRAELFAIQWRTLDSHLVDYTLKIQREETALEARNTELGSTDHEIELMRHEQRVVNDAMQEIQRRYYSIGNEITRIEQDILHHQEREQLWTNELSQVEIDASAVKVQKEELEDELLELEHELQSIEPQFIATAHEVQTLQGELQQAEQKMQTWQGQWDDFILNLSNSNQSAKVETTNINHLEQRIQTLQQRQEQLQQEQSLLNFSGLHKEVEEYLQKSYEAAEKLEVQDKQLADIRNEMTTLQSTQQDSVTRLHSIRGDLQKLCGQQASLEALQQTALGQRDNLTANWLEKHKLSDQSRLAQCITVANGWEQAVEKVLGFSLQAICVDNIDDIIKHLEDLTGNLHVYITKEGADTEKQAKKGTSLLEKVSSPWSLDALLANVYTAENLKEAMQICKTLKSNESVITPDGTWLSPAWLKVLHEENPAAGVFEREQAMKELGGRITQLQKTQQQLEKSIEERKNKIVRLEEKQMQLQQAYNQQQAQSAQVKAESKMKQERLAELKLQSERLMIDQEDSAKQLQEAESALSKARETLVHATNELEQKEKKREQLIVERDQLRQSLQSLREHVESKKEKMHESEIRIQTAKSHKNSQALLLARLQNQLVTLNERKITLQSELSSMPPLETVKKSLSRALDRHVTVESELNTTRVAVESLEQESRNLENKKQVIEREVHKLRNLLESLRLEAQGWRVKADSLQEQIKETEFRLEDVLRELPQAASQEEWQTKYDQLNQRINRLGPINLIAIEEYATCLERKQYLDQQMDDLNAGLTTLETAIGKIDKETKHLFKQTFDRVNERFQELFPIIFGGGRAYLDLTSEDLLTTGVTVMACPPGKRNSTIYLLSGGEKSLTALALIFSIFHLNPAPFCLLDEVDAALDDANVLRFTRLLKTMAEKTQFIFISHNKITIEIAEHLIGVTMNEPGVSRLVSVDIEKAMTMAES